MRIVINNVNKDVSKQKKVVKTSKIKKKSKLFSDILDIKVGEKV